MQKDEIIRLYLQGFNISEIERETGITRPTIRKYVNEYEYYQQAIKEAKTDEEREELIIQSNAKPKYDTSNRKRYKVTDELIERVEELLKKNQLLQRAGKRKLMMKKVDIHDIVIRDGFDISYRRICQLIDELSPKYKEAYIRQEVDPGEVAEFDWGEVTLSIKEMGGERRFRIAAFALKNSDQLWANLYPLENTECFLDAHANFIEEIDGVPQEIVYDNARVQVRQFVGNEKKPTEALQKLSNYYGFKYRFTNFYAGNEKGHVERFIEVIRRKAFCEVQCFDFFADAVAALKIALNDLNNKPKARTGKSANEAFEIEKQYLQPARIRLDVGVLETRKVNKYSFIYVDSNFYSVPDYLVGKEVTVKKYPFTIKVYYQDKYLLTLKRIYGRNEYKVDMLHYVRTIKKKPGAIRNSLALKQSSTRLQHIFNQYFTTKPKEFIELLLLIDKYSLESVLKVVDKLEEQGFNVEVSIIENHLLDHKQRLDIQQDKPYLETIEEQCMNQLKEISRIYYSLKTEEVII